MTTVTVDIIDDKAMNLLKDLEAMNIIKLHDEKLKTNDESMQSLLSLKGKMRKQSIEDIEKQLADFREE